MKRVSLRSLAVVCAAAVLLLCAPLAPAQQAGYDLLQTPPGAVVTVSGVSPGTVTFQGVPICACTGLADTIMHRSAAAGGHANLTVVALFLKNSVPVTRNGRPVDVYVTINNSDGVIGQNVIPQPDPLPPSTGTLTIRSNGTFDSSFTVHADIIIVAAGADVRNPATPLLAHTAGPPVTLASNNNVWSSAPPAGYPQECFFPSNGFYLGGPVPETAPTGPHQHPVVPTGPPINNEERCITFNPAATMAQQVGGRWKVMESGHVLFDFDSRQADAQKTVSILQHYHMTQTCTVGMNLPGELTPPFQYELVGNNAPSGSMPGGGEDCIGFNNASVTDQDISGRWTIVDGDQWMFNFGPQKAAADRGVALIKNYKFNQSCFVGRPDTGGRYVFVYMKAGPSIPIIRPPVKNLEFRKQAPGPGPVEKLPIEKKQEPVIKR